MPCVFETLVERMERHGEEVQHKYCTVISVRV
jgi:hypothetical protein